MKPTAKANVSNFAMFYYSLNEETPVPDHSA